MFVESMDITKNSNHYLTRVYPCKFATLRSKKKLLLKITDLSIKSKLLNSTLTTWSKAIKKTSKKCIVCDHKIIESHHLFYKHYFPDLCLNLNSGVLLCKRCHNEVHGKCLKGMKSLKPVLDIRNFAWVRVK